MQATWYSVVQVESVVIALHSALERMSGKIVNSARHPNAPLVTSGDHDIDLVGKKVDLNAEHGVS